MSFDENLAARVRRALGRRKGLSEKKMFGGLGFLFNGNMCCGVYKNDLIIRLDPAETDAALKRPGARPPSAIARSRAVSSSALSRLATGSGSTA